MSENDVQTTLLRQLVEEVHELNEKLTVQVDHDLPMTREQAARFLNMHPDTLYKLARENKIAYSRKGDGKRSEMIFLRQDLEDYLDRMRIPAVD